MITKNDILIARDKEKKALKAQAIAATKEYLEGEFSSILNSIFIEDEENTVALAITQHKKYDTVFFTPVSKMNSMYPPSYDLKYFLQELRNSGFEVTEDKCYARSDWKNIIIKI